jgi:hypothetical protein
MAKLENVKILDMVNGEPTRVEYNGAVYEKTEEKAKEGDLVRVIDAGYIDDVIQGGFYKVYADGDGGLSFDDEDDCERDYDANQPALETFRKVSETKASADLAERLAELERRLEALEERAGAKESELKVGDYGKIIKAKHGDDLGKIVIIDVIDEDDYGIPYRVSDAVTGEDLGWYSRDKIVKATEEEFAQFKAEAEHKREEIRWAKIGRKTGEFKKGDLVRYKKGMTEVIKVSDDSVTIAQLDHKGKPLSVDKPALTLLAPVEQRFDLAVEPKVGARQ